MKKALMFASVASMIKQFNMENIDLLKQNGYEVDVAANFSFGSTMPQDKVDEAKAELRESGISVYDVNVPRKISMISEMIDAYKTTARLCKEGNYEIIHCHSPIGGVICRLAARKARRNGTRVIYTAHGFHFFKGAPLLNWLIYCPIEWICSFFTDTLITINKEDYAFAKKHMHAKEIVYVPGVGINMQKFDISCDTAEKRAELSLPDNATLLLSVGELSTRKNHRVIIEALAKLKDENVHYLIVGRGDKKDELEELAKSLGLGDKVHLLGFRSDISELCHTADIFCFPSIHEGLPVALMEAMAAGMPCVASAIRGNTDLIENGKSGFLCRVDSIDDYVKALSTLIGDKTLRDNMVAASIKRVESFDISYINEEMKGLYGFIESQPAEAI